MYSYDEDWVLDRVNMVFTEKWIPKMIRIVNWEKHIQMKK